MRRATHYDNYNLHCVEISIHALLAESDSAKSTPEEAKRYFYPRSPCGERRHIRSIRKSTTSNFYPRSPCGERRQTRSKGINRDIAFLSTLSLRRATNEHEQAPYRVGISIHALLAESDIGEINTRGSEKVFLSTLSLRRATIRQGTTGRVDVNFYPRSPCGERRLNLPSRPIDRNISIHALLAESDSQQPGGTTRTTYFYPRSPCGERPHNTRNNCIDCCISIHALLAESDRGAVSLLS